jgi:hypothetical protein
MTPKTTLERARMGSRAEFGRIDGTPDELAFQARLHRRAEREANDRERMEQILTRLDSLLARLAQS